MPLFLARWADASFSVVCAENDVEASFLLDEFGDAPIGVWNMESCAIDFELTNEGTFRLNDFGECTLNEIMARGYPALEKLLDENGEDFESHGLIGPMDLAAYGEDAARALRDAVATERARRSFRQRTHR